MVAGIRADGGNRHRLPKCLHKHPVALMAAEPQRVRPLTVAGAAQVRPAVARIALLLPVELRHVNHTASTNSEILRETGARKPYNG